MTFMYQVELISTFIFIELQAYIYISFVDQLIIDLIVKYCIVEQFLLRKVPIIITSSEHLSHRATDVYVYLQHVSSRIEETFFLSNYPHIQDS
jgi:hypothetical protein